MCTLWRVNVPIWGYLLEPQILCKYNRLIIGLGKGLGRIGPVHVMHSGCRTF